jgi:urea transport system permease protein
MMLAPTTTVEPFMGLDFLIRSFFSLVVGGLGSLEGLGVGVTIIGGMQSLFATLVNQTFGYLLVLAISVFFLWIKPNGIYSKN